MEFLKNVLSDELYNQFALALNAYNGNEANAGNQIKLANLATGTYVSKDKYGALEATVGSKDAELQTANDLIAQLKAGTKGNEELQQKIGEYNAQMMQLQTELQETKIKSAIKVALLSEKAVDVDYLTFKLNEKLKEKGEILQLDENDNIKGWTDVISTLKTQFPTQFESSTKKKVEENKLPKTDDEKKGHTRQDVLKMSYAERNELFNTNPEAYHEAMGE